MAVKYVSVLKKQAPRWLDGWQLTSLILDPAVGDNRASRVRSAS